MTQALQELGALIASKRPDCVLSYDVSFDELTIEVAPSNIVGLVDFLKSNRNCRFSTLVDITAVDYPGREKRFDVVYHLLSMYQNHRVRLRASVRADDMVASIVEVHPSANWFEREIFDMFGILFWPPGSAQIADRLRLSRPSAAQRFSNQRLYGTAL